jgi:flagellar biosynthesis protein
MSEYNDKLPSQRAVALKYDDNQSAPVIVASGIGSVAEKIVEVASENGVPVYEDTSLATMLSKLEIGTEIPEEIYKAVVDIYVYFLKFSPENKEENGGEE